MEWKIALWKCSPCSSHEIINPKNVRMWGIWAMEIYWRESEFQSIIRSNNDIHFFVKERIREEFCSLQACNRFCAWRRNILKLCWRYRFCLQTYLDIIHEGHGLEQELRTFLLYLDQFWTLVKSRFYGIPIFEMVHL